MLKIYGKNYLHSHLDLEEKLGVGKDHVIIDRKDWEEIVDVHLIKKERRNTIDGCDLNYIRVSGNTTRQIDYAIQLLYGEYIVEVRDHYESGKNRRVNQLLFDRIRDRILLEHRNLMRNEVLRIDRTKLELELIQKR